MIRQYPLHTSDERDLLLFGTDYIIKLNLTVISYPLCNYYNIPPRFAFNVRLGVTVCVCGIITDSEGILANNHAHKEHT